MPVEPLGQAGYGNKATVAEATKLYLGGDKLVALFRVQVVMIPKVQVMRTQAFLA